MNTKVMEAGLLAMARKYIELMIEESQDDHQRLQREMGLTYRWDYEYMELSENLIGISVGVWRGMPGDQTWDQWEHFSVNCSTDFECLERYTK